MVVKASFTQPADRLLHQLFALFRPHWQRMLLLLITVPVLAVLGTAVVPEVTRLLIDLALPHKDLALLALLVSVLIAQALISGFVSIGQDYLSITLSQYVIRDLRLRLFTHLQRVALRFYTREGTGEMLSRLTNDVNGVKDMCINTVMTGLSEAIAITTTLIIMLSINVSLTLLSLGLTPIFLYLSQHVGKVVRRVSKQVQEATSDVVALLEETLNVSGALLIKSAGQQQAEIERMSTIHEKLMTTQIRQGMLSRWFLLSLHLFFNIVPALVYYLGGLQVIGGQLSLGSLVAFVALQYQLFPSLRQLLSLPLDIQTALALFERLFAYLALPVEISDRPTAKALPASACHIRFRQVTFGYEPGRPVLHAVDFEIRPGQLVALVGPSGAGKTTVSYLLRRLYDVQEGAIEIDGYDVRDVTLESLGKQIGMVMQDVYLLNSSVYANIAYACPHAMCEEIVAAAQAAQIHERIIALPQGYDTVVGPRGYILSGGEKQRIALARMLLKRPRILVLDEATSALDTHVERLVQLTLARLQKDCTTLAIAHRLSTVRAADLILVLDHGRIVERGTHAELLHLGGLYARLYNDSMTFTDA